MEQQRLQELIGPDYRLQWVIGHGGMSTVWLADDTRVDREVAIKVLRPEFSDNEEFLGRFRNEAVTAQQIHADHVVETYDYRELEDANGAKFCFMALEYIRGESLADLLAREGQLPEDQALNILEQAAQGLSVIHSMGMVHRDIKPGNLLVTQNGQVKITDFGIAKAAAAVPLTRTGMVVGTAQYVSPEQAQGHEVTSASDCYSLGVVGYEMLAGQRPFSGDSSVSVALAHISQSPAALSTTISAPARELIGIALRKDPGHRYADGAEFAAAISRVRLGQRPPQPAGTPVPDTPATVAPDASTVIVNRSTPSAADTEPEASGNRKLVTLLALLGVGVVGAAGYWIYALTSGSSEEVEPTPSPATITEYIETTPTQATEEPTEPTTERQRRARTTAQQPTEVEQEGGRERETQRRPAPQEPEQAPDPEEQPTPETTEPQLTPTEQAPPTRENDSSPLDSLIVNPTHFATNPNATL